MGKPSSGKDAEENQTKGKKGKDGGKNSKNKGKAWSAYRKGETAANYRQHRETRAMKGLKRASRSTVAKSRDRPGRAERRQALCNRAQEVDTAPQEFALLPINFNPDPPPKRRRTRPAKEETDAAPKEASYSYYSASEEPEEPSSSAGGPDRQEQGNPLLSLTKLRRRRIRVSAWPGPGAGEAAPAPNQAGQEEPGLESDQGGEIKGLENSESSVQVIHVETAPWQRRTVKKEAERLPEYVHFVGHKIANIWKPKDWHHETFVMSKNPLTGERTSVDLSKLGQGTRRHVWP